MVLIPFLMGLADMVRGGLGPRWIGYLVKWLVYGGLVAYLLNAAWWQMLLCGILFGVVERVGYGSPWASILDNYKNTDYESWQKGPLKIVPVALLCHGAIIGLVLGLCGGFQWIMVCVPAFAVGALVAPYTGRVFRKTNYYWKISEFTRSFLAGMLLWLI